MISYHFLLVTAAVFVTSFSACQKSTEPDTVDVHGFQIPGCNGQFRKAASADSCFSYQFHEELIVDFCASGNCCPDSDRFSFEHAITNDTIIVTVADTAARACRCNCLYLLRVEFQNLQHSSYLLICKRQDNSSQVVLYSVRVYRGWPFARRS